MGSVHSCRCFKKDNSCIKKYSIFKQQGTGGCHPGLSESSAYMSFPQSTVIFEMRKWGPPKLGPGGIPTAVRGKAYQPARPCFVLNRNFTPEATLEPPEETGGIRSLVAKLPHSKPAQLPPFPTEPMSREERAKEVGSHGTPKNKGARKIIKPLQF